MKKHFSHPHPLKLSVSANGENIETDAIIICSGCEQTLLATDPVYTCSKRGCEFFLHRSCSDLPRNMDHKSHPDHGLTLLSEPPEHSLYYNCNACGDLISGFSFHCNKCEDFRLHVKCAFLAESVDSKAHLHTLSVEYSSTHGSREDQDIVVCDVCESCLTEGYWFYFCKECDFRTHLECAISAEGPPVSPVEEEDHDEEGLSDQERLMLATMKAEGQMARLQFQMQMAQLNAQTISNLWR
ncbi:hypothetical protein F511_02939 [Dorcoceras hygrometricum]|uniref:DC1 domain-containing protein n=1 Tax=Dorcoceras hygrometricum TaxID=472368 RepID=A0A2Z7AJ32_9LAMI|nr:hypothetical protein F511_02939 [Dorcoceras hygrometricum]